MLAMREGEGRGSVNRWGISHKRNFSVSYTRSFPGPRTFAQVAPCSNWILAVKRIVCVILTRPRTSTRVIWGKYRASCYYSVVGCLVKRYVISDLVFELLGRQQSSRQRLLLHLKFLNFAWLTFSVIPSRTDAEHLPSQFQRTGGIHRAIEITWSPPSHHITSHQRTCTHVPPQQLPAGERRVWD